MYMGISNQHMGAGKGHKLAHNDPAPQTPDRQTPQYYICLLYPLDITQLIYLLTALGKGEEWHTGESPEITWFGDVRITAWNRTISQKERENTV